MAVVKTPPVPAEAADAADEDGFTGAAGTVGAPEDLLDDEVPAAPAEAEVPLLLPLPEENVEKDGREARRPENGFSAVFPAPAPDPPVRLLIEGNDGKLGNAPPEVVGLRPELELLPHPGSDSIVDGSSWLRMT
jgi:hypothetical protein